MRATRSRWARRRPRSRSRRMPTAGGSRVRSGRPRRRSPPSSGRAMKLASLKAGRDGRLVVVSRDRVRRGPPAARAGDHVKLVLLVNDVTARALIPDELAKGFGFLHGKPASAFSPVAVTPDELGSAWREHKVHLPLLSYVNDAPLGRPNAGVDMTFDFARLIEHAAKTRHLAAGTIVGSGTVANDAAREQKSTIGSSCLAERRMLETLWHGAPKTPWLKFGDRVRIEMQDGGGRSIFGAIEQEVVRYLAPPA